MTTKHLGSLKQAFKVLAITSLILFLYFYRSTISHKIIPKLRNPQIKNESRKVSSSNFKQKEGIQEHQEDLIHAGNNNNNNGLVKSSQTIIQKRIDLIHDGNNNNTMAKSRQTTDQKQRDLIHAGNKDNFKVKNPTVTSRREIYQKRRDLVKKVCEKYDNRYLKDGVKLLMIKRIGIGYCPIPKTGTTTWNQHIAKAISYSKKKKLHFRFLIKFGEKIYKRKLEDVFTFAFVRHPFVRIVSAYTNKVIDSGSYENKVNELFRRPYVSFERFVQYILKNRRKRRLNDHVKPYYRLCNFCGFHYDVIGKLETSEEDFKYVIQHTGLKNSNLNVNFVRQKSSIGENKQTKAMNMISKLPKDKIEKLIQFYKPDFEMFGYDISKYYKLL